MESAKLANQDKPGTETAVFVMLALIGSEDRVKLVPLTQITTEIHVSVTPVTI